MHVEEKIIEILKKNEIRTILTVPCKFFESLLNKLKREKSIRLIWPAREEEALGISAGLYLGGERSVLLIQNSGLGNMINAIKSLSQYYGIPFFAIISHRGGPDEKIEAQKPMGETTPSLFDLLDIRYEVLENCEHVGKIDEFLKDTIKKDISGAVLIKPSFWKENE